MILSSSTSHCIFGTADSYSRFPPFTVCSRYFTTISMPRGPHWIFLRHSFLPRTSSLNRIFIQWLKTSHSSPSTTGTLVKIWLTQSFFLLRSMWSGSCPESVFKSLTCCLISLSVDKHSTIVRGKKMNKSIWKTEFFLLSHVPYLMEDLSYCTLVYKSHVAQVNTTYRLYLLYNYLYIVYLLYTWKNGGQCIHICNLIQYLLYIYSI